MVIIGILIASLSGGGGSSGNVTGTVRNVVPLDGNTVRIYIDWTNHGKAAGSASCAINTTVNNQFGDQVNIRVNSTSSNGNIKPGQSRLLYQDIGVDNNDAQYVKASDVKLVGC